ncbi:MAG: transposase [Anaerolineales bacterium]|nr:transposase [Anaerolineales bacterium]
MARVVVPEYPHHVTQRGNRRQPVFLRDGDCACYLTEMRTACQRAGTRVLAYCLMPNHVHFVMIPQCDDGLRAAVADAHRRYTRSINFREGWRGHLWQERFHSVVMDEFHLQAAVPYVENNPVRAGLCALAAEWLWSSAAESVAPCAHGLVDWNLRAYLLDHGPTAEPTRSHDPADEIRRHTRTGRPLGAPSFVDQLEAMTGRALAPRKPGPTRGGGGVAASGAGSR